MKNIFFKKKTKYASHFHNTCPFRKISAKAVLIKKNQQMHFKQNTKAKQSVETNQHSKKPPMILDLAMQQMKKKINV